MTGWDHRPEKNEYLRKQMSCCGSLKIRTDNLPSRTTPCNQWIWSNHPMSAWRRKTTIIPPWTIFHYMMAFKQLKASSTRKFSKTRCNEITHGKQGTKRACIHISATYRRAAWKLTRPIKNSSTWTKKTSTTFREMASNLTDSMFNRLTAHSSGHCAKAPSNRLWEISELWTLRLRARSIRSRKLWTKWSKTSFKSSKRMRI